jgi:integration host factor subunit alpha
MALTKKTIFENVRKDLGYSENQAVHLVETMLEIIKSTMESGEDVLVSGFGKFCVQDKSPRRGRNPATGKDLMLDARKVVTFKCSGRLKDRMNKDL